MESNRNKADFYRNSKQSECYAKYRLSAPQIIVDKIISYLSEKLPGPHEHALDVGCGTGQSTRILAPYFEKVTGTDISETQLFEARRQPDTPDNVQYEIAAAESLPFEANSLQLITASTCVHWFDRDKFIDAAKTMLQDNGVLAIYFVHRPYIKGATEEQTEKLKTIIQREDEQFRKYFFMNKIQNGRQRGIFNNFDLNILKDTVRVDNLEFEREVTLASVVRNAQSNPTYRYLAEDEGEERAKDILNRVKTDLLEQLGRDVDNLNENEDFKVPVTVKCTLIMGRK